MDPQQAMKAMSFLTTHEPLVIVAKEKATGRYVSKFTKKLIPAEVGQVIAAIQEEADKQWRRD